MLSTLLHYLIILSIYRIFRVFCKIQFGASASWPLNDLAQWSPRQLEMFLNFELCQTGFTFLMPSRDLRCQREGERHLLACYMATKKKKCKNPKPQTCGTRHGARGTRSSSPEKAPWQTTRKQLCKVDLKKFEHLSGSMCNKGYLCIFYRHALRPPPSSSSFALPAISGNLSENFVE